MELETKKNIKIAGIIIISIIIGMNIIAIFIGLISIVFIGLVIWMIIKKITKAME